MIHGFDKGCKVEIGLWSGAERRGNGEGGSEGTAGVVRFFGNTDGEVGSVKGSSL